MFYSTDILVSRRSHFGLYWLAATVGAKGGTGIKKLTRKEVLAADVVAACERLAAPEEPLSLRLSSNLLCGIARVYQQQYNIYQSDVTQVHQSLKKAFNDVFKNPLVASTVDMVTTPVTPTGAGAPGITLQEDPGLAVLGWDKNWDVGIDWGAFIRGGGLEGAVGGEIESEFGSGVEREGTPDSSIGTGKVRAKSSGKHIVKDLATITLHEPHIDDYLLQDVDMRIDDGLGDQPLFGENEPGLLEGMDPELDRSFGINTEGRVYPVQYGAGGASSSAQGGYDAGVDLGGMDDLDLGRYDEDGQQGFELPAGFAAMGGLDETYEERVRREHDEAAAQRAGGVAPRASSVDQPQLGLEGALSTEGSGSRASKRKAEAGEDGAGADVKKRKSPKKVKPIVIDSTISLTDEQVVEARRSYPERMKAEREKAEKARREKEEGARAVERIFGVNQGVGGEMASFWTSIVSDQLTRPGEGRGAKEKKRKAPGKGKDEAVKKRKTGLEPEAEVGRSGEWGQFGQAGMPDWEVQHEFGGGEGQDLGGMDDLGLRFDDDDYGRARSGAAGTGGDGKESFPWADEVVTSDGGAGYGFPQGSSQAGKISGQGTPLHAAGDKRRSRSRSLVPSALGSGRAGSQPLGAGLGAGTGELEEFEIEDQLMGSAEESMRESQQQAMADAAATKLELDSLKFLSFARRRAASQPHAELLFSDIVPVASTSNGAASAALYHLLNLTSKGEVRVSQPEAYGEITVELPEEGGVQEVGGEED